MGGGARALEKWEHKIKWNESPRDIERVTMQSNTFQSYYYMYRMCDVQYV